MGLLRGRDTDLALVFGYDEEPVAGSGLVWRPLATEPVHLVLPPGHALVRRRGLTMRHLASEPWIVEDFSGAASTLSGCARRRRSSPTCGT